MVKQLRMKNLSIKKGVEKVWKVLEGVGKGFEFPTLSNRKTEVLRDNPLIFKDVEVLESAEAFSV